MSGLGAFSPRAHRARRAAERWHETHGTACPLDRILDAVAAQAATSAHDLTDDEIDRVCRATVEAWEREERARIAKEGRAKQIEAERAKYLRARAADYRTIDYGLSDRRGGSRR
jgi:hypothetical protein